jgi:hypothetical protein
MTPTRKAPNGEAEDPTPAIPLPQDARAQDHGRAEREGAAAEAVRELFYPGGRGFLYVANGRGNRPLDHFSPRF